MVTISELKTFADFCCVKKGDIIACEFHRNMHDCPKAPFKFGVFKVVQNTSSHCEIILQKKNNLYFNYKMFIDGSSNLKCAYIIQSEDRTSCAPESPAVQGEENSNNSKSQSAAQIFSEMDGRISELEGFVSKYSSLHSVRS